MNGLKALSALRWITSLSKGDYKQRRHHHDLCSSTSSGSNSCRPILFPLNFFSFPVLTSGRGLVALQVRFSNYQLMETWIRIWITRSPFNYHRLALMSWYDVLCRQNAPDASCARKTQKNKRKTRGNRIQKLVG
jgi:hypothetical protein